MSAPERIWANEGLEWHSFDCSDVKAGWTHPYILATPAALAASPEVAKLVAEAEARGMDRAAPTDPASAFNRADWFWRAMDPDDCGDSPEEAINRAMVGCFCVCEIASSYAGPTRYGFIAPVLDPESDDEEFVHFATQQEAIDEAKRRANRREATK